MKESDLRDLIAKDITTLESGLTLLSKEQHIPNSLGTRSFIDLYARDAKRHHVLIELKKSDASAREALHEIHKYVEGVKQHLGARDDEIRIIVASTEWRELVVPFSRLAADTKLAVSGLMLHVDEVSGAVTSSPAPTVPLSQGRLIAPWHEVNWYENAESLANGIASIESSCKAKGIKDYVIVVLRPPEPVRSEHQAAMQSTIQQFAAMTGSAVDAPTLPLYRYIAYFAMQTLTPKQYLSILEQRYDEVEGARESASKMNADEALKFFHELTTSVEPRPNQDHYEIGYPAKFTKFIDYVGSEVQSIRRYGVFGRNQVLDDESILSELRGEDGSTGQRIRRTLSVSNPAHMASARSDVAASLDQNRAWKNHILAALDEIQKEFPGAEVDVSVYNPCTGILTLFFPTTRDDGFLYVPTYSLIVRNPEPTRMYYGGLQAEGSALTLRQLLSKYYDGDLGGLLLTMTWGGREARDSDIIEDLGLAYRSFRCDIESAQRTFFALRDERWRPSDPIDIFKLFGEYIEKNEKLVQQIVEKISARSGDGLVDASSVERLLAEKADVARGRQLGEFFVGEPDECDLCGCPFSEETYMIDGKIRRIGAWGCICADCFGFKGEGLGWGLGQLYLKEEGKWLLVGGFPPASNHD